MWGGRNPGLVIFDTHLLPVSMHGAGAVHAAQLKTTGRMAAMVTEKIGFGRSFRPDAGWLQGGVGTPTIRTAAAR